MTDEQKSRGVCEGGAAVKPADYKRRECYRRNCNCPAVHMSPSLRHRMPKKRKVNTLVCNVEGCNNDALLTIYGLRCAQHNKSTNHEQGR